MSFRIRQCIIKDKVRDTIEINHTSRNLTLTEFCNHIEEIIPILIPNILTECLVDLEGGIYAVNSRNKFSFYYEDEPYEITSRRGSKRNNESDIVVSINSLVKEKKEKIREVLKLNTPGSYNSLTLYIDKSIEDILRLTKSVAEIALNESYKYVQTRVFQNIPTTLNDLSKLLNYELRGYLPKSMLEDIWMYIVFEGEGIYLLDEESFKRAINVVGKNLESKKWSPISLVSKFGEQSLKYEKTFAKKAIESGRPFDFETPDADYIGTGLSMAERFIYGSESITTHPVFERDNLSLFAGYSTGDKRKFGHYLTEAREDLMSITMSNISELEAISKYNRDVSYVSNRKISDKQETREDRTLVGTGKISNSNVQINVQKGGIESDIEISQNVKDLEEIIEVVRILKDNIENLEDKGVNKNILKANIDNVEIELDSSNPDHKVLKESLNSIRSLLEGAAGSMLATGLTEKIPHLIALLETTP